MAGIGPSTKARDFEPLRNVDPGEQYQPDIRNRGLLIVLCVPARLRRVIRGSVQTCPETLFHRLQHCPAAVGCPAIARKISFQLFRAAAFDFQTVVVEQFLALLQIAQRHDVDAISYFIRLAVRRAGVIYPLRFVPTHGWINHFPVVQAEELCVVRVLRIGRRHIDRDLP